MNIGIICYPTFGGSGVIATELGKSLAKRGHNVHFITYDRPVRLDFFAQNIYYHEVNTEAYPLFQFLPYETALTSKIVETAMYHCLDLLHVHYAIPHAASAYMAREILKTKGIYLPFITTLHGTDITLVGKEQSYEPVVTFSINQSDGITSVSEYLKTETFNSFPIEKEIEVIPNFVDLQRFKVNKKEIYRKLIAPNDEKLIIHTSNFRKVKRVEDVLKTFLLIRKEIPSKLIMVGDGPERSSLEKYCRENNIISDVIFMGKQDLVEEALGIADLFLMPSGSESFGLAALEAMACGLPVISTNVGGLPEVVHDGYNGFVCPLGDVEMMAIKSLEILNDPELYQTFSANAKLTAQSFDIETIVIQYEEYYKKIANLKSGKCTEK